MTRVSSESSSILIPFLYSNSVLCQFPLQKKKQNLKNQPQLAQLNPNMFTTILFLLVAISQAHAQSQSQVHPTIESCLGICDYNFDRCDLQVGLNFPIFNFFDTGYLFSCEQQWDLCDHSCFGFGREF